MSGVEVILGGSESPSREHEVSPPTTELGKEIAEHKRHDNKHLAVSVKYAKASEKVGGIWDRWRDSCCYR